MTAAKIIFRLHCQAWFPNDNYRDLRTVILWKLESFQTLQENTNLIKHPE